MPTSKLQQLLAHRPLVGALAGGVTFAGAFQRHAAGVIADPADRMDFLSAGPGYTGKTVTDYCEKNLVVVRKPAYYLQRKLFVFDTRQLPPPNGISFQ